MTLPGLFRDYSFGGTVVLAIAIWYSSPTLAIAATTPLAIALLLFGLPHGALDLAVLRRSGRLFSLKTFTIAVVYCAVAAIMGGIWLANPTAALGVFVILAALHFADDWAATLPPFLAHGTATALLVAPALFHYPALTTAYAAVAGLEAASVVATLSLLIAPVAIATACVGVAALWTQGARTRAIETTSVLAAMLLLPPLPGFALFFCILHSPDQFRIAAVGLARGGWLVTRWEIATLTTAALAIAAMIYILAPHALISDGLVAASFITLSILTLPHIAVPWLLRRWP